VPIAQLAPLLEELCRAALEPDMEPASSGEVKVLLRCVGALLKKHSQLVQQTAFKLLVTLQSGCAANRSAVLLELLQETLVLSVTHQQCSTSRLQEVCLVLLFIRLIMSTCVG
jgi:hypothetical protein